MTTRADGLREVEAEISALIRRVKRVIGERAEAVHPELQGLAYLILGWLRENGPTRATAIVEAFQIDKGALSRQLQHLEDVGLIQRSPDPADGRASIVAVTGEAVERMTQVDADHRKLADERLGDWSAAELRELAGKLRRYNQALG